MRQIQLGHVLLNPAVNGRVRDDNASLSQHFDNLRPIDKEASFSTGNAKHFRDFRASSSKQSFEQRCKLRDLPPSLRFSKCKEL
jgi:hypothetical protein